MRAILNPRAAVPLVALALAIGLAGLGSPARAAGPAVKGAIIVGPGGAELTPIFIQNAGTAAPTPASPRATSLKNHAVLSCGTMATSMWSSVLRTSSTSTAAARGSFRSVS